MTQQGNKNAVLSKLLNSSNIVAKESVNIPTTDKDKKLKYEPIDVTIIPLNNRKANEIYSLYEKNTQKLSYEIIIASIEELKELGYEDFKALGFGTTSQLSNKVLEVSGLQDTDMSNKLKNF